MPEPSKAGAEAPPVLSAAAPSDPRPWRTCHEGFRTTNDPARDVLRLGLLCGPSSGMARLDAASVSGRLEPDTPVRHVVRWRRGACYRVFAAGSATIERLSLVVRSSRGIVVASEDGRADWAVLYSDRPMCALADDNATIEIVGGGRSGAYTLEVWKASAEPPAG